MLLPTSVRLRPARRSRTIAARCRVSNPPFYGALVQMGFGPAALPNLSLIAAITFVDTVVSHEPFTERLLFQELVHIIQYEKLGLAEFAAKYARGWLLRRFKGGLTRPDFKSDLPIPLICPGALAKPSMGCPRSLTCLLPPT